MISQDREQYWQEVPENRQNLVFRQILLDEFCEDLHRAVYREGRAGGKEADQAR